MRALHLLLLLSAATSIAATAPKPKTPSDIVAAARPSEWRAIPDDELLVLDFAPGKRVVIQLAPAFAPAHVANIRALARGNWWDKAKIYRVQDNYVVQWGNNEDGDRKLPAGVAARPPAEYHRPLAGLGASAVRLPDAYASAGSFARGWPIAIEQTDKSASVPHCYGYVGVGRDLSPDTGMGGELYAVIGHAPRHLDRNIAVVGRVIAGIDALSSLPRGTEALGFYKDRASDVAIGQVRLADAIPAGERPRFQYLDTGSNSFAAYLHARANRQDDFFIRPAGGVDLCNAPVPIRPAL